MVKKRFLTRLNFSSINIVLIIIAIVLAVFVINKYIQKNKPLEISNTTSKSQSTQSGIPVTSMPERRTLPSDASADEKAVLNPPNPDASSSLRETHYKLVTKLAQASDVLDLNKCDKPSPLVYKVEDEATFEVKNNDSVSHTFMVDNNHEYTIPANESKNVKASFGKGPGAYGYFCDGKLGVVGFFFVTPNQNFNK